MKKIDRDTFEFQMRLIKAELKVEELKEINERLTCQLDNCHRQIKCEQEYRRDSEFQVTALNKFIKRFIELPAFDPTGGSR